MSIKLIKLIGMFFAASMDIGVGIIVVHLMSKIFAVFMPIHCYLGGIFFSLLPDLNIVVMLARKKKIYDHRAIDHYPAVIVPVFLAVLIFSKFWAITAVLCMLLHFIHDSIERESAPGIQWFAPLGSKYYIFFSEKGGKRRVVNSWTEEETAQKRTVALDESIKMLYLKVTPESISGVAVLLAAIITYFAW